MSLKNILIADDHEIVIHGLQDLLQDEFGELNTVSANNGDEVFALIDRQDWDLILLDIMMPGMNIIDLLAEIRRRSGDVPVLILTAILEPEYAVRTIKAGANGYITKQYAADELIEAVRKVMSGETYLSKEAADALTNGLCGDTAGNSHDALSSRELEVFCLIAKGKTVKEIAFELSISTKTIGTYIARIKDKTGLGNYVDIARYALRHKLVE